MQLPPDDIQPTGQETVKVLALSFIFESSSFKGHITNNSNHKVEYLLTFFQHLNYLTLGYKSILNVFIMV